MKKLVFKWMVILFTVGFIVACSDDTSNELESGTNDGTEATNDSSTDNEGEVESNSDRPTIQYFVDEHASWPWRDDMLVWELMEDGGNMNIDYTVGASPFVESLNLVIASGDLPDLISMPNYTLANDYGGDGALVNLLDHIDNMPNLQAWSEEYPDAFRRALSHDGKMYISPNYGMGETNRMLWLYRDDVFQELGLEIPNNWDELHQVLTALKEEYPDSYPLGFRNGTDKIRNFAPNFGTNWDYYYDFDDEEWRYGPMEDNFLVLLEYLNTFYSEGLISPDFLSIDTGQWQELISSGKSFITQDYIGRIDIFNNASREENPEFTLLNMPPPAGFPGGEQLDYSAHQFTMSYSIASTSEHIDTLIQYIDWTFSEEGRDTLSWGIEGETYEVIDGTKQWIQDYPSPSELRTETGISLYSTYTWFDYDSHMTLFSDEVKQAYEEDPQYDAPIVPSPAFTPEEQDTISIKGEEIKKHRDQEVAKFIIGERDLNEWNRFVEEIETLGVQEIVDIYKTAHDRMLEAEVN